MRDGAVKRAQGGAALPDGRAASGLLGAAGLFLLAAAVTAGWMFLNFFYPDFETLGIRRAFILVAIHVLILLGLWLGLSRTDLSQPARVGVWLAIAIPFTVWLGTVWALAVNGVFSRAAGALRVPPLPVAIFVPVLVGLLLLMRSTRVGVILDATPPSWLIGIQAYRVFGGIFLVNWAKGLMPGAFALPAGTGDVLVGLLALPVAFYVSRRGPAGRAAGIAWNLLGLADFAVAIAMGAMSSPGPLQAVSFAQPNRLLGTYPSVMIPAFAVPSSIILHVLSLWQLRRLFPATRASA